MSRGTGSEKVENLQAPRSGRSACGLMGGIHDNKVPQAGRSAVSAGTTVRRVPSDRSRDPSLVALQVMGQGDPDIVAPPSTTLESVSGWERIGADHRPGEAVAATEGRAIAAFNCRALTLPGAVPLAIAKCDGAFDRTRCSCHGSTVTLAWWPPS